MRRQVILTVAMALLCSGAEPFAQRVAISWTSVDFRRGVGGDVEHVTELLLRDNGQTLWAAFYGSSGGARLAASADRGRHWAVSEVPGLRQVRSMVALSDGSTVLGGSADAGQSPLIRLALGSQVGGAMAWQPCGTAPGSARLPGSVSDAVWDVVVAPDGALYVATDSLRNDPRGHHSTVYRSTDGCATLVPLAPLPGLGALSLAVDAGGRLFVSMAESAEHDDADAAGRARIFWSDDAGRSWRESGAVEGANRIYRLTALADGSVMAGSGLRGRVYRSTDRGLTWQASAPVPDGTRPFGDPPAPKAVPATRVYAVTQLSDGAVVIGTGNAAGDLFVTTDGGRSWESTGDTGPNIVCWAIVEAPDGTVWIGTGSRGGDIWVGRRTGGAL